MNSSSAGTAATAFWIVSSEQATRSCTLNRPRAFPRRSSAKELAASPKAPDRRSPRASPPVGGVAFARGAVVGGGVPGPLGAMGSVDGGGAAAVAGGRVAWSDGLGAAGIVVAVGAATEGGGALGPTATGAACAGRRPRK